VYRTTTAGDYKFIHGEDVSSVMRYACTLAYPDARHYMRLHIDRIMAHSNRVTACLALNQANISVEDIAFRLCWQVPSIQFYIRESYPRIGDLTPRKLSPVLHLLPKRFTLSISRFLSFLFSLLFLSFLSTFPFRQPSIRRSAPPFSFF
jgi:hypothetical protein